MRCSQQSVQGGKWENLGEVQAAEGRHQGHDPRQAERRILDVGPQTRRGTQGQRELSSRQEMPQSYDGKQRNDRISAQRKQRKSLGYGPHVVRRSFIQPEYVTLAASRR